MSPQLRTWSLVAWLVLGRGAGAQQAGPLALESPAENASSVVGRATSSMTSGQNLRHEALDASETHRDREHVGKAPPAMLAERPGAVRPGPDARWVEGYWDWDKSRKDFAWVTGTWLVPPPGEFWVNGYWRRDARGWFRLPGFWSGGGQIVKDGRAEAPARDARPVGPPLNRPEERIGAAPGPDFFYIPGEFVPGAGGVVWRPGFWARSQPGWEWIPARWDRRATGWAFREGFWSPVSNVPSPLPGGQPTATRAALVSAPANSRSPFAGMNASPFSNDMPTPRNGGPNPSVDPWAAPGDSTASTPLREPGASQLASRDESNERPEAAQAGPDAGQRKPTDADTKPADGRSGPQPATSPQPGYPRYTAQPGMYSPGRAVFWNARSVVGGLLGRIRP